MDYAVPADHMGKLKESEKRDKRVGLARELKKKTVERQSNGINTYNWCSYYSKRWTDTRTWGFGNNGAVVTVTITVLMR